MLRIGMFFCSAGIIAGVFLVELAPLGAIVAAILLLLALAVLAAFTRLSMQPNKQLWIIVCAVCVTFLVGQLYGQWRTRIALAERLPISVPQTPVRVVGDVTSLVEQYVIAGHHGAAPTFAYQFDLRTPPAEPATLNAAPDPLANKTLRVRGYHTASSAIAGTTTNMTGMPFAEGDQIDAMMTLASVHGLVNGVGPDSERAALARGIDGYAKIEKLREVRPARCCTLTRWRAQLSVLLANKLSQGSVASALIPALVAGDRRKLEPEHWRVLQSTGLAHLISISGLHISLVCGALWWFCTKVFGLPLALTRSRLLASQLAVFPALLGAIGYAAMAGFSLPTSRALLMTLIVMLAHLMRLRISPSTVLLAVLFAFLLINPLEILGAGFWLSFLAVGLLMALLSGGMRELVRAQILLSLGSGVFAGWLFSAWSLVSILVNLVMVPLFSFVMIPLALIGAFMAVLFDKVSTSGERVAEAFLHACAALIDGIWPLLNLLAQAPVLEAPASLFAVLTLMIAIVRFLLPFLPGPRWLYLFLVLPWLWPQPTQRLAAGQFELVVFDVGQGQMTAVRTANNVLLYDSGPQWRQGSAVTSILRPWLVRENVRPMLAFISHGDTDHSGGYADMRSLWPQLPVFSGDTERVEASLPCLRGQAWRVDGVRIEVLWPAAAVLLRHSNNRSCVVKITSGDGASSALLSGDIELPVEFWLAQHGEQLRSDVLQVPHHGSQTSSSYGFIRAVKPRWASVSSGYQNRFHHPAPTTQQRYQQFAIPMVNTSDTGLQRFIFARGQVTAAEFARESASWPWRVPMPVIE